MGGRIAGMAASQRRDRPGTGEKSREIAYPVPGRAASVGRVGATDAWALSGALAGRSRVQDAVL